MNIPSTTNTSINAYSSYTGSAPIGVIGATNLSLTSSSTIIQTTTQTLILDVGVTYGGGTIVYMGSPTPQTYMQATRIA